jgi:hypothetical protein
MGPYFCYRSIAVHTYSLRAVYPPFRYRAWGKLSLPALHHPQPHQRCRQIRRSPRRHVREARSTVTARIVSPRQSAESRTSRSSSMTSAPYLTARRTSRRESQLRGRDESFYIPGAQCLDLRADCGAHGHSNRAVACRGIYSKRIVEEDQWSPVPCGACRLHRQTLPPLHHRTRASNQFAARHLKR